MSNSKAESAVNTRSDTLVFSIALNGYQYLYHNYLQSHKRFALRHGYAYELVKRPYITQLGVECCWLKLTLLLSALEKGFKYVMFIDADAYVHSNAPKLTSELFEQANVLMARSYSGRYNSGVIMVKNHYRSRHWLNKVICSKDSAIASENSVGWGENGHIIEHSKQGSCVGELAVKWNNTYIVNLPAYITHFCHGPMRRSIFKRLVHRLLSRLTGYFFALQQLLKRDKYADSALETLTQKVINHYPTFDR